MDDRRVHNLQASPILVGRSLASVYGRSAGTVKSTLPLKIIRKFFDRTLLSLLFSSRFSLTKIHYDSVRNIFIYFFRINSLGETLLFVIVQPPLQLCTGCTARPLRASRRLDALSDGGVDVPVIDHSLPSGSTEVSAVFFLIYFTFYFFPSAATFWK